MLIGDVETGLTNGRAVAMEFTARICLARDARSGLRIQSYQVWAVGCLTEGEHSKLLMVSGFCSIDKSSYGALAYMWDVRTLLVVQKVERKNTIMINPSDHMLNSFSKNLKERV